MPRNNRFLVGAGSNLTEFEYRLSYKDFTEVVIIKFQEVEVDTRYPIMVLEGILLYFP